MFGCATEVEDECTGDHARVTEARHGYVRLLWRLEGAICYVRCGAPVCCGAKKVSLGPSGYLSFFTCKRRQHAAASLPLVSRGLWRGWLASSSRRCCNHELRRRGEPLTETLPCHSDVRCRLEHTERLGRTHGESTGCATYVNFGEEERHATIVGSSQTKTEAATSSVAAVSMDELVAETPPAGVHVQRRFSEMSLTCLPFFRAVQVNANSFDLTRSVVVVDVIGSLALNPMSSL